MESEGHTVVRRGKKYVVEDYESSLYGLDFYSKSIDVAHAKSWTYDKPSVFLTSACLMGRIDRIPPQMNMGLTMLHAGCNCFVGATRTTSSEAGLTILENHLIVDDFSIGEVLRGEKRSDKEPPNYYVRVSFTAILHLIHMNRTMASVIKEGHSIKVEYICQN